MDDQPKPAARRSAKPATTSAPVKAKAATTNAPVKRDVAKRAPAEPAPVKQAKSSPKRTAAAVATRVSSTMDVMEPAKTRSRAPRVRAERATPVPPPADPEPPPTVGPDPRWADVIARFGPDARDWLARTRERYPAASPAALGRLAAAQRRPGSWLVLAIAAANGVDPTDPARAADLRELAIHSGRLGLEGRARARYSQETWPRSTV
jgi:hypothetical protein